MPGHAGNRTQFSACQLSYVDRSVRVCDISEQNLVPSIPMQSSNMIFSVLVLYMYSGEYDICDVTMSVYPHRASLKNMPGHGGNRTYSTFGILDQCSSKYSRPRWES